MASQLCLSAPFTKTSFNEVMALDGQVFRQCANRRVVRIERDGQGYFIKTHQGVGWREILKNLLTLRLPVLGASNEYHAIKRLHALGIATMDIVGYGKRGVNPATQQSFIITKELSNIISLETLCATWGEKPPSFALKQQLLDKVTAITKQLHDNGINHRDLYLCHFILDKSSLEQSGPTIYLIDLHRAQQRQCLPLRWRVKDVGGLYFSALHIGLTKRDCFRFMKRYTGKSLRRTLYEDVAFWRAVASRALKLDNEFQQTLAAHGRLA
ncbi:MAG: lipopolysaccharide core heptose(I) kinase RfaP [Legionellales bacterium]|nr:lipopolysaccharide core heptose(I) kinase RfaP [Legionellales bacterium]|tara:strand:+ start:30698 stop:31504 length:807 start_codon:yes stop_codon:yes gene_type:complete